MHQATRRKEGGKAVGSEHPVDAGVANVPPMTQIISILVSILRAFS
jgi:hypothetical protein